MPAIAGEFDRVGEKVEQNLLQRAPVGFNRQAIGFHHHLHIDVVGKSPALHQPYAIRNRVFQAHRFVIQFQLARFDFRHIEQVGDQVEQKLPGIVDQACIFRIARVPQLAKHLVPHDVGETDNGV